MVLRALHTPGHSRDHCCFVLEHRERKMGEKIHAPVFFSGDNVLGTGTSVMEDVGCYLKSLTRMHAVLTSAGNHEPVLLCPGHGDVVLDGAAKVAQYIEHRQVVWRFGC